MEQNRNGTLLKLDGRIVVVSGAAGGGSGPPSPHGRPRRGDRDRGEPLRANLDRHIGPLMSQGLSIVPLAADAQTEQGVAAVMDCVRRARGDLHGLVNVAAARRRRPGVPRRASRAAICISSSRGTSTRCSS